MTKKKGTSLEDVARLVLHRPAADDGERGGDYGHGNSQAAVKARITLHRVPWMSRTLPFWDDKDTFDRACAEAKRASGRKPRQSQESAS